MAVSERTVEWRLTQWARWAVREGEGLGWPRRNALARLMSEGAGAGRGRGDSTPTLEMPREVADTEAALLQLKRASEALYDAALAKVLERGADAAKARARGITRAAFESRWRRAKQALAGWL